MNEVNISYVDVHELKKIKDSDPSLCLIDVREQHEWDQLHIPGAIHIPKDVLAERINSVVKDKQTPIYIHCKGGIRSSYAAHELISMGYQHVYSVDGGIQEWAMFGYEVAE